MTTAALLAELKQSPQLPDHIAELQTAFEDEQRRRKQFIEEIDEDAKAEFVNGEVVIHSPARMAHTDVVYHASVLLGQHVIRHSLGKIVVEQGLVRCLRNDYMPDINFFQTAKMAGWNANTLIYPPPDLAIEVLSPSTERNDRTVKFQDYAAHGVSEYWIIDANAQIIEQYTLATGATAYTLLARVTASNRLRSPTVRGFDVPAAAVFDAQENQRALAALLQQG